MLNRFEPFKIYVEIMGVNTSTSKLGILVQRTVNGLGRNIVGTKGSESVVRAGGSRRGGGRCLTQGGPAFDRIGRGCTHADAVFKRGRR